MADFIKTIMIQVEVQENGILRIPSTGRSIGRLSEDKEVSFENLSKFDCKDMGNVSDGYHTFNELYHHRMVLFSVICNTQRESAWKSWKHADGTMFNDYFIVGITTPKGDYTYHYHKDFWGEFKVKELDNAPEWDGHKPNDIDRLHGLYYIQEEYK